MPHPFPHRYEVSLSWLGQDKSELSAPGRPSIPGGPPPEFDGTDPTRWSPEHLLLTALAQCLLLTFLALAKRPGIELKGWNATAESVLDKTKDGLVFTSFKISVKLKVPADRVEQARQLVESAKKHCIVANALKTPATLEAVVEAS